MRVAVVGTGVMGRTHAEAYANIPGVKLVGIYTTRDVKSCEGVQFGTTLYTSLDHMISEAKPDVVSICLPTHLHKDYVIKVAEMGIHVICEKPIAPTLSEAREMIRACKRNGVRLFIAHIIHFFPDYQNISRQILEGVIGEVGVVHTKRIVGHPGRGSSWYNDSAKSGGVIMDLMIHDIDFVRSVNGEVESVYAMHKSSPGIEYALITLKFQNGVIGNLEGLWGHPSPLETACEFAGKKGMIRSTSEQTSSVRTRVISEGDGSTVTSIPLSPLNRDPYRVQLEHFIDCIRDSTDPIVTAEDAYKAIELSLAAIKSAKIGKPINMSEFLKEARLGGGTS